MILKHLDLFSGIGGFSLGLEATGGFETVAFCDVEEFPRKVLQKHWPDVKQYKDIKELTYEKLKADGIDTIDILTCGYPCQPFSVAGRKKGEKDPRHLWPEYFRLVKECRPTWVIGENVGGHIKLGLDTVLENLESQGYAVRTFSIPASAVGANHKRERVWIVAYSERNDNQRQISGVNGEEKKISREHREDNSTTRKFSRTSSIWKTDNGNVEDTRRSLWQGSELQRQNENEIGEGNANQSERSSSSSKSDVADTKSHGSFNEQKRDIKSLGGKSKKEERRKRNQSSVCSSSRSTEMADTESISSYGRELKQHQKKSGEEGTTRIKTGRVSSDGANTDSERLQGQWSEHQLSESQGEEQIGWNGWWQFEPNVGRVAHGVPSRVDRLKGLGNSLVPYVPYLIGQTILKTYETRD
jgi:DNA (cytosine-5)-methyltransferase 1